MIHQCLSNAHSHSLKKINQIFLNVLNIIIQYYLPNIFQDYLQIKYEIQSVFDGHNFISQPHQLQNKINKKQSHIGILISIRFASIDIILACRQMGAIIAFFKKLGETSNPKATKDQHMINIANLNYCGIMKSPFQFYSGKYQPALEQLSHIFQELRPKYVPWQQNKPFSWQFAKLDKKIKDRYCPLYDITAGIENGHFITKQRFKQLWQIKFRAKEEAIDTYFGQAQKLQTFKFDLLAFHTLLFNIWHILDVNKAASLDLSVKQYLKVYEPFFAQSFLDQKSKLQQFKKGLEASYADVVFIQEPDELLINDVKKFQDKYFISVSPDNDTLIFAKKSRFTKQYKSKQLLQRLTPEQFTLLNWNEHTAILFLDDYFMINGHLNSKKEENAANVKDLVTIMPILLNKYKQFDIICGMDANSYIAPFNDHIHMFPDKPDQFTSIKKRTSMQVQSAKSEKLVKELKDAVMTTLPIQTKYVMTIEGTQPSEKEFLPLDEHPFDHFLVFVVVNEKKK